ncbi:kinesin-like protein KIF19 [Phaethornis superciliosus]
MCTSLSKSPSPELAASARKEQQLVVALRIRPINAAEVQEGAAVTAHRGDEQKLVLMDPSEDPDDILRANRSREKTFIFDMVFDHRATQEEVYVSTTKSLIGGVISGYNATIFAYGPTGAGKTYTMLGTDCEPGIYIRSLEDLFKALEAATEEMDYRVSMSYLEIYNEVIRDLLNPSSGFLDLREDPRGSIQIAGLTEVSITNAQEVVQLLMRGNKQRTQEPTAANPVSSRSHAVLQVTVTRKRQRKGLGEEVRVGKLFMVDLAGSERAAQSQNRGKRMKEGAHINRSLLALGNCINALSEKGGSRAQFVNFRDSKLTRLLKDSLGGNSRTVMIAHISPASTSFEESRMTLIYAYRAKNIKTQVKCNLQNVSCHINQYTSIITDLHREIEHLKERVKNQERKSAVSSDLGGLQGKSSAAERHRGSEAHSGQVMNTLREQLLGAFREQMEMCHRLMELENTNIELHLDTCRHLLTITDWEREKAQGALRYGKSAKEEKDENTEEKDKEVGIIESPEPLEVTVAREEINLLLAEQRRTAALKTELEQHLASAKEKASQMEEFFPRQITSEDQQEVLRLLCRAHELELGNTELQANTLYKENLLCQKDFVIQQLQQHMLLCEEIIQQQQMLIKAQNIPVPETLLRLHHLHLSELEEGTLNRLFLLHSMMSNMLRPHTSSLLDMSQHLDLNKDEVRKCQSGNTKDLPWGMKFDIPSITLESDSGSCLSSKTTPSRNDGSLDVHHSPTFSLLSKGPVQQQKPTGVAAEKMTPTLSSPTSLGLHGKKSPADIASVPLSLESLMEIAANTKSISLIAARRRSRAQHRDLGSEVSSAHFSEEDMLELKDPEANSTPDFQTRGSASNRSLLLEPAAWNQLCSPPRRHQEMSAGKKRSRSLDPNFHRTSKDQDWTPSSPTTDKACENHLHRASLLHPSKAAGSISIATKVKVPITHHSARSQRADERILHEVLPKHSDPAGTSQQNRADRVKDRVLQKQMKDRAPAVFRARSPIGTPGRGTDAKAAGEKQRERGWGERDRGWAEGDRVEGDGDREEGDGDREEWDRGRAEGDEDRAERDRDRVERDEDRAERDEDRAERDGDRAERDEDRAERDGDRAERDEDRAERAEDRAERDEDRAERDGDRAERDEDRAERDGDRAERDEDRAERDGDRAERDEDRAERDEDRAERDGDRAERDEDRAERDEDRAERRLRHGPSGTPVPGVSREAAAPG